MQCLGKEDLGAGARSVKPRAENSLESLAQVSDEVIYKGKSQYEKMIFISFYFDFCLGTDEDFDCPYY